MWSAKRRLIGGWAMLMGLSLALALVADVRAPTRLGALPLVAIGAVVLLKAWPILSRYLELAPHPGALRAFMVPIALTLGLVLASFATG